VGDIHIAKVKSTILPVLGLIFRIKGYLRVKHLKKIYYSLIHSRLMYLAPLWGCATHCLIKPLQILQRRAIQIIFNMPIRTSSAQVYNTSQILPISVCIDSSSAVLVYRSLLYNLHITYLFQRRYPAYQLRTDSHLPRPQVKTSHYGLDAVVYKSITEYNNLPLDP